MATANLTVKKVLEDLRKNGGGVNPRLLKNGKAKMDCSGIGSGVTGESNKADTNQQLLPNK